MTNGIVLALLAYATYAWSDAAIKALGGSMSVFQIGFFQLTIAGSLLVLLTRPEGNGWRDFWRMSHPLPVQARAVIGLVAGMIGVYAFTTIPLAEVYALAFLSPLFVTILSMVFLKEQIGPWRWAAVIIGFLGVLVVVRPGFRALELGHAAALMMAILSAASIILQRSLASRERTTTILGYLILYAVLFNGVATTITGFEVPQWNEAAILMVAGAGAASGHIFLMRAIRLAPVNQLAPTHYSQIAWAVLLGAFLFNEQPDIWSVIGLAVIAFSGLLTVARERIRLGTVRWNPFGRTRL
ncbi:MAG: DMT family transporter [Rhizobiaceae bacterium]|nr:DMT family transporter [Rhizobiaceae bacterium]